MSSDITHYKCVHCYERTDLPLGNIICKKSPTGHHEWKKVQEGMWIIWLIGIALVVILSLTLLLGPPVTLANSYGSTSLTAIIISAVLLYGLAITQIVLKRKNENKWSTISVYTFIGLDIAIGANYIYNVFANGQTRDILNRMFAGMFIHASTLDTVLQIGLYLWIVISVMGIAAYLVQKVKSRIIRLSAIGGASFLSIAGIFLVAMLSSQIAMDVTAAPDGSGSITGETNESSEVVPGSQSEDSDYVPEGFKKLLLTKVLFKYDYQDLIIESSELASGWYEFDINNANNEKYGGDPEIMPRIGSYRYYPKTGQVQVYDVVDDTWYDWEGSGEQNQLASEDLTDTEIQAVRKFVHDFVMAGNGNDLDNLLNYYADEVDYYSWGSTSKKNIRADKEKFIKRWPVRDYMVQSDDIVINGSSGKLVG